MGVSNSILLPDSTSSDDLKASLASPVRPFGSSSFKPKPTDSDDDSETSAHQLVSDRGLDSDLGLRSGFLPGSPPVCRMDGSWARWEEALDAARGLEPGRGEEDEDTRQWRRMIREELPVLEVDALEHDIARLRRAHLVLAFLMHFYVHSGKLVDESMPNQLEKIPKGIAVPLCAVSKLLDMPPVLTYADTVLYNWRLINPADGFTPENILIETTFTNTPSEEHFFKTSLLVEVLGPTCLSLMKLAIDEAIVTDTLSVTRIASSLLVLATLIDRLRDVVEKVRDHCDPAIFYWQIRPWFHGGQREMEGVVDSKDPSRWLITDFGGPSAGQSTLIHSLDVFLGVDHRPHPSQTVSSNPMKQGAPSGEETFMARMAVYMPSHHRRFLSELAACLENSSKITTFPSLPHVATHSVRSLALATPATSDLRASYNDCVSALGRLRSTHSKVALLYIVSQSRHPPPEGSAYMEGWLEKQKLEAEKRQESKKAHLGTGGTDLAKFLKRCRERTKDALID
ncbi:hypothetical protein MJO28_016108 [Puccinia striiformis f. sp. tritici]|uniref:Indoleamine 2,3-dioxygenase n=3 Tax=Puccinia striiformis TaxID=27350 RepID=A0A0L0W1U2_9BASI|nr:hypothetical protein Pst134EA_028861 [Puccinia striiformis f. sp. tritici]KNF05503.1 hypothetical protein PSTG_01315 [Puccinia striiformis f. sp. tritici PST-78]POW15078.1 hypothetical protein PSHT_07201 [Puccinia striiformis]KAH9440923.1 hypothetical protein Pst134EB_029575 [Puccinia striiformis f. sp. tritici]KAH9446873.1 hypothetical protein Pst134EA_028861 [Puccinia striiformis f. sp. tritici]KAI7937209.1 hypothetical protein MJO28_016108 [Puccinia striiformis f. sp. tritici]